ncbi:MAG: GNAT family N-acetyltransferase [Actinomycetota bacterium]|nr:GNAT family N-acetyltransferase [Actinomycetota bacterium]
MSAATTPRAAALPEPPHLADPKLTYVAQDTWGAWQEHVQHGFHEAVNPDWADLGRRLFPRAGCFGMRVGDEWVSTASSTDRMLGIPGDGQLRCAAVSDVTVSPSYRRRGLLRTMMRHQLETVAGQGAPMAALWASESSIYGRFGYGVAAWSAELGGQTARSSFVPEVPTSGSTVEVDSDQWLAAAKPVWEVVRAQQPGMFDRAGDWWDLETWDPEKDRAGFAARRYVVHYDGGGRVDGVGSFAVKPHWSTSGPDGEVKIGPVLAITPSAYAGLWRHQLDVDLAQSFSSPSAAVDEPLLHLLADPRALQTRPVDGLYLRILDVHTALAARAYFTDADVVLQLSDPILADLAGCYRVRIADGRAEVSRTDDAPDLSMGACELASCYLGGTSFVDLQRAGRVTEHSPGAVRTASAAFKWDRAPHCPDHF